MRRRELCPLHRDVRAESAGQIPGQGVGREGGENRAWEKAYAPGQEEDKKDKQGEHKTLAP